MAFPSIERKQASALADSNSLGKKRERDRREGEGRKAYIAFVRTSRQKDRKREGREWEGVWGVRG
jgi:hypothetical protein